MDTKLTLRLNKSIIERAKLYAQGHKTSLSQMIEYYLDSLTKTNKQKSEITPLVESISGVVKLKSDYDFKDDYANYLNEKYK
jgi:hypothetical protein